MNNEIKNRTEAYLSWLATGIQPEGWDLEQPRNKQEYWLSGEAERLDRIERENGGEVETGKKAALRSSNEGTYDYNALDNIPILPMPADERVEEGQFYYQLGESESTFYHHEFSENEAIFVPAHPKEGLYFDTTIEISTIEEALIEMASHTEPLNIGDEPDPDHDWYAIISTTSDVSEIHYLFGQGIILAVHNKVPYEYWSLAIMGLMPFFESQDIEDPEMSCTAGWNLAGPDPEDPSKFIFTDVSDMLYNQGFWAIFGTNLNKDLTVYANNPEICSLLIGLQKPTQKKETIGQIVNNEFVPLAVGNDGPIGGKLVQHNIKLGHQTYVNNTAGYVTICNDSTSTFDFTSLKTFLEEDYFSSQRYYPASGLFNGNRIYGIYSNKKDDYISILCNSSSDIPVTSSDLIVNDTINELF